MSQDKSLDDMMFERAIEDAALAFFRAYGADADLVKVNLPIVVGILRSALADAGADLADDGREKRAKMRKKFGPDYVGPSDLDGPTIKLFCED